MEELIKEIKEVKKINEEILKLLIFQNTKQKPELDKNILDKLNLK